MASRTFDVEYDDFSGGYFVGPHANKQPQNTWLGVDAVAEPGTGYLMANDPWYKNTAATVPTDAGNIMQINGQVFTSSTTSGLVYANSSANSATLGPQAFTAANTNWTPTAGTPKSSAPMVLFNNKIVIPATGAFVIVMPLTGPASTLNATPQIFTAIGTYDYWIFGTSSTSVTPNRAYYCSPNDPTTWSSANYYDIGDPTNTILIILSHQGQVYFGGTQGWYVGIGVPGATFSLRKINGYSAGAHAIDADTRVLTPSALQQAMLAEVAGQSVTPVNWAGAATAYVANADDNPMGRIGPYVLTIAGINGATTPQNVHVLNLSTRVWHVVSNPSDSATGLKQVGSGQEAAETVVAHDGANLFYRWMIPSFPSCGYNQRTSAFTSATVQLPDFPSKVPFRVKEVLVDCLGDFNSSLAQRSVSVRVIGAFPPNQIPVTDPASTRMVQAWSFAGAGQQVTARFNPTDCLPAYWAQVELGIQGVKVKRVVMRCEETV